MFLFQARRELEQICAPSTMSGGFPAIWSAILEALREAGALQAELIVI